MDSACIVSTHGEYYDHDVDTKPVAVQYHGFDDHGFSAASLAPYVAWSPVDTHAHIHAALAALQRRSETAKVLFILADGGIDAAVCGDGHMPISNWKAWIDHASKMGIMVVPIGMGYDIDCMPAYVKVDRVDEPETLVPRVLRRIGAAFRSK